MLRPINPSGIAAPLARYSHAIEVPPGSRLIVTAGQVGLAKDGTVPPDADGQSTICLENIRAILAEGGMSLADIVRINTYVAGHEHLPGYIAARERFFAGAPPPASTLLVVAGLARPQFFIEIEVTAAKRD